MLESLTRGNVYKLEGNYKRALYYYDRLREVSPQMAEKISSIRTSGEGSGRAEETGRAKEGVVWEEE